MVTSKTIALGSLVFTTRANYFITLSAGEMKACNQSFYAISANTPIAKILLGKEAKTKIQFRNQEFEIIKVI
jgi:hypothetical protein